jgi:hypothetical protein
MQIDITKPISQVTFAQLVGVGPRTVTQLLARGIIKRGGSGQEWLIDYTRHLREVAGARQTADGKLDLVAERAAYTLEQRKVTEIKRRQMEGALVETAEVRRIMGQWLTAAKDRMLAMGGRLGVIVAPMKDPGQCSVVIDAEARAALADLVAAGELRGL